MSDRPALDPADLTPEMRRRLGIKLGRRRQMGMDAVRGYALRVLAVMADLSARDRARILRHALKVNNV